MKKVVESKPVVAVAKIALPIEVGLALRIIPPHIARVRIAIKRIYRMSSISPPLEYS